MNDILSNMNKQHVTILLLLILVLIVIFLIIAFCSYIVVKDLFECHCPSPCSDAICLAVPSESLLGEAVSDKLDLRYSAIVRQNSDRRRQTVI